MAELKVNLGPRAAAPVKKAADILPTASSDMKRTTVYLTEANLRWLKLQSVEQESNVSALINGMVDARRALQRQGDMES
jgi:hypothetical protein